MPAAAGGGRCDRNNLGVPAIGTFEPIDDMIGGDLFDLKRGQWNWRVISRISWIPSVAELARIKFFEKTKAVSIFLC